MRTNSAIFLVLVCTLAGCANERSGTRVVQHSRTRGTQGKQAAAAPKKTAIDPRVARENELFAILSSKKVRKLSVEEQALAAALAMKEIAELRDQRGDVAGAEEAIERAVREARAARDANFVSTLLRDRFRIYRAHALKAADRGDFANSLKQLDKIGLFGENTPDERRTIASDRFLINDRREEHARANAAKKSLPVPGEEQVDTKAVLAEADRVFAQIASFETKEVGAGQAFLDQISFELNASNGGSSETTMDIVPATNDSEREKTPEISSKTRGHESVKNEHMTVELGTKGFDIMPTNGIGHAKTEAKVDLPRSEGPLVETGKFDTRTVAALVSLNKRSVTRCYDRSLRAGERLTGKLEVRITVQPSGIVTAAELSVPQFAATELGRCVQQTLSRWRFPPFTGSEAQVSIPFFLKGSF